MFYCNCYLIAGNLPLVEGETLGEVSAHQPQLLHALVGGRNLLVIPARMDESVEIITCMDENVRIITRMDENVRIITRMDENVRIIRNICKKMFFGANLWDFVTPF